jgi:hypothetical protein
MKRRNCPEAALPEVRRSLSPNKSSSRRRGNRCFQVAMKRERMETQRVKGASMFKWCEGLFV